MPCVRACVSTGLQSNVLLREKSLLIQFLMTGFEDAETACCGIGLLGMGYMCNTINPFTCSDASKYVFWDSFLPTEKANGILADNVVKNSLAQFL